MSHNIEIAKAFNFLFKPKRYKVAFGGRGGAKTISFVKAAILLAGMKERRFLCLREFMNSIDDSVHAELVKEITDNDLENIYKIKNNSIEVVNGSIFKYAQLARNIASLKSKSNFDVAWVEEAETITDESLDFLIPTIRKPGSELWFSFNPKDENGAVYKRFVKPHLTTINRQGYYEDDNLYVTKVGLLDNPFAPKELLDDFYEMKENDPQKWAHIYGGECGKYEDTLINPLDVKTARQYQVTDRYGPKIIGVDPAWSDADNADRTAIAFRQGRCCYRVKTYKHNTMGIVGVINSIIDIEKPHRVFIDVVGIGAGVYDRLVEMGHSDIVKKVNGGSTKSLLYPDKYKNKRAECWGLMRDWLKDGDVQIPDNDELQTDLCSFTYDYDSNSRLVLESKKDLKKRGFNSPDCFIGETLIATPFGEKRIDEIKTGEYVVTPYGNRKVILTHCYEVNEVYNYKNELIGTGKHRIFSTKGLIRLDALQYTFVEKELTLRSILLWRFLNMWITKGKSIGFKTRADTISRGERIRKRDFFIDTSGQKLMGKYQKDTIFTTLMETGQIAFYLILKSLKQKSIGVITCLSGLKMMITEDVMQKISRKPKMQPENGMAHQKELSFIDNLVKELGKLKNQLKQSALFAIQSIKPTSQLEPSFAHPNAHRSLQEVKEDIKHKRNSANAVEKSFYQVNTRGLEHRVVQEHVELNTEFNRGNQQQCTVKSAGNLLRQECQSKQNSAVQHTESGIERGRRKVYNLTLEHDNVYYANGYLVENCGDALSFTFADKVILNEQTNMNLNSGIVDAGIGY